MKNRGGECLRVNMVHPVCAIDEYVMIGLIRVWFSAPRTPIMAFSRAKVMRAVRETWYIMIMSLLIFCHVSIRKSVGVVVCLATLISH